MAQILIIEDDIPLRQALTKHLEELGHVVRQASHGAEAIASLQRLPAAVAIVDIFMPGQGGLQTIGRIKQDWPETGVIAISGAASGGTLDVRQHALALGADRFLRKPFDVEALVDLVNGLLPEGAR